MTVEAIAEAETPLARPCAIEPLDTLSDVLRAVRLTGCVFFLTDSTSPWVVPCLPGATLAPVLMKGCQNVISYHMVIEGEGWCEVQGYPPIKLQAGDVLVLPHGDRYVMSNAPGMRADSSDEEILAFFRMLVARELPFRFPEGGGGPDRMCTLCGFLCCDALPFNPVFATLPRLFTVHRKNAVNDRLSHLFDFALAESREKAAGSQCVLLKISELMFVEVVRQYLVSLPIDETGWLAGLRDPVVGKALANLHERPAESWTLESLARESGASRSVLAERFSHFVGQPPMQYLTRWRLQLAAGRLARSDAKVSAVAIDVGYDSEAAFSRAFKKMVGVPPSAWRRRHASESPD